jgi:mannose-6-phosphate isomerase-like protein (cupin superfamily)
MQVFTLEKLLAEQAAAGTPWREFLRVPSLSMGVYQLKAGEVDRQQPHTEDEIYYIVRGRSQFRAGAEVRPVGPGTILFVGRLQEHRFFDISEDLTALVFFAPAEGSLRGHATPGD